MRIDCEYGVELDWQALRPLRERVDRDLNSVPNPLRESTVFVICELVENAIKYGISRPEASVARVEVHVDERTLRVGVTSGIRNGADAAHITNHVELLSADAAGAHADRLDELLRGVQTDRVQLGLLQIREVGYSLRCESTDTTVTLWATRSLA